MIGLFCRILSLSWVSFAKETYHFKEPTNRSHPISGGHAAEKSTAAVLAARHALQMRDTRSPVTHDHHVLMVACWLT